MAQNQPKELRIQQIIDNAVLEFLEKGYEGTSMESIAKRAELSKGGVYHHFKSKDEILMGANNRFMEPVHTLMNRAGKNKSPVEGLKIFIREYLKHWSKNSTALQFTFLSLYKIMANKHMWPAMEDYYAGNTAFFRQMLQAAIECKELKVHDTESKSIAMAFALDGVTPYLVMSNELTYVNVSRQIINGLLSELEIESNEQ